MSMWQIAEAFKNNPQYQDRPGKTRLQRRLKKFTHWPNPFGQIKDITVVACSPDPMVLVTMWSNVIASFWWSNFVPSPTELFRNWLTGRYRCGMTFDFPGDNTTRKQGQLWGPLDVIWSDGSASLVASESLRPVLQGAWFLWATGTAFSALQQYSTIMAKIEACDDESENCILASGQADLPFASMSGSPVAWTEINDPLDAYSPPGSSIHHERGPISTNLYGVIGSLGNTIDYVRVEFDPSDLNGTIWESGGIGPGEKESFSISAGDADFRTSNITPKVTIVQHGPMLSPSYVFGRRWLTTNLPHTPNYDPNHKPHLPHQCTAPGMPPWSYSDPSGGSLIP